ncbi:MAG: hypothetical protein ACTHU0_17050 [Kofleriaceae bacterium]
MPLGYCMQCAELKPIVKVAPRLGSRECEWAPVEHSLPATHRGCGGLVYDPNPEDADPEDAGFGDFHCNSCIEVIYFDQVEWARRCPGSGQPIR